MRESRRSATAAVDTPGYRRPTLVRPVRDSLPGRAPLAPRLVGTAATIRGMDYGLCLPNFRDGSSREGMEAAAEVAERLGWSTVWTTDHLLVAQRGCRRLRPIYEAVLSLAWLGARYDRVRLGTSVIVVPYRNAVILAKELATLDSLSGGRLIAGVGVGWSKDEFANLGIADRYHVRGAISTRRSSCGGTCGPDHRAVPRPLPHHRRLHVRAPPRAGCRRADRRRRPGRRRVAPRRCARGLVRLEAKSFAKFADRIPVIRAAAEAAGRPMPSSRRGPTPSSAQPPTTGTRSVARPRRWPPRSGRSRPSGSITWRCGSIRPIRLRWRPSPSGSPGTSRRLSDLPGERRAAWAGRSPRA